MITPEQERDALRAQVETLTERERHFAGLLGVADGGQYRNDWDARIQAVLAQNAALTEERNRMREALETAGARRHAYQCDMFSSFRGCTADHCREVAAALTTPEKKP